jgi:hypothetical protein
MDRPPGGGDAATMGEIAEIQPWPIARATETDP